jgi:hypothetical protein
VDNIWLVSNHLLEIIFKNYDAKYVGMLIEMIFVMVKKFNENIIKYDSNFTWKLGKTIMNIYSYCFDELKANYSSDITAKIKNFLQNNKETFLKLADLSLELCFNEQNQSKTEIDVFNKKGGLEETPPLVEIIFCIVFLDNQVLRSFSDAIDLSKVEEGLLRACLQDIAGAANVREIL